MKLYHYSISNLLFALFIIPPAFGQTTFNATKNQLKLSPLKIIDLINPGLEISYERQLSKRLAIELSYCYQIDPFNITYTSNFKGQRFGLEQKYSYEIEKSQRKYFSSELRYLQCDYNTIDSFGYKPPGSDNYLYKYLDSFHLYRKTFSVNIKVGRQFFYDHFVIDISVGLGLKYKNISHGDGIAPNEEMQRPRHPNAEYMASRPGKYFTPNVPLTLRIGYFF